MLTGEEEGSLLGGVPGAKVQRTAEGITLVEVPQPRRFYCLTAKGKEASDVAWGDPLQALYQYPLEYRHKKAERLYRGCMVLSENLLTP